MRPSAVQEKLVQHVIRAVTTGDGAALDELLAPEFVGHAPRELAREMEPQDRARRRVAVERMAATLPDMRAEVHDQVAEGDRVAFRWSLTGTHEGSLLSVAPTGRRLTLRGTNIVRMAGARIVEDWVQWDALDVLHQLGRAPPLRRSSRT